MTDAAYIITTILSTLLGLLALYFVIKLAVRHALAEHRLAEARIADELRRAEASRAARSS
ncbi:MAG TPA: hypothetical protein VN041_09635 [Microbacterium sp.]|nr:hypothetical protein [Microbacterium sp.]